MKRWLTSESGVKFEMSPLECERFDEFTDKCNPHPTRIIVENNSIGWVLIAHCPSLKIEKNITDVSKW